MELAGASQTGISGQSEDQPPFDRRACLQDLFVKFWIHEEVPSSIRFRSQLQSVNWSGSKVGKSESAGELFAFQFSDRVSSSIPGFFDLTFCFPHL